MCCFGREIDCSARGSGGAGDCDDEPPSAKTCSSVAVPPPDDVGVPPTVIATYSLPPIEKIDAPAAIWWPVWNVQSTLPRPQVERAQDAVAAAGEPEAAVGRRDAAALRLRSS